MNKDIVKGRWKEMKGKLKQQWGKLTDDEITTINGNYEELEGKLEKLYGYQKDRAEKEIDTFIRLNHWDDEKTH